jgi:tRNA (guanine10-N2)-dimethyltransferase
LNGRRYHAVIMALLVELSGEQLELANHEAWAAASTLSDSEVEVLFVDHPALVLDAPEVQGRDLAQRLGLAHHVSDQAITGPLEFAGDLAGSIDIGDARSFRVRVRKTVSSNDGNDAKLLEAKAGAIIQERTGVQVDLEGPEVEVRGILAGRAHAGLLGGSVDRRALEARAVRNRPFSQPVSIHPKFARAMVNLARAPIGGVILDPFCGTGGMLMEAALLGYRPWGTDFDPRMVEGSRENLSTLGLEAELDVADVADAIDARDLRPDAIVTDPPYGRSTSVHGRDPEGVLNKMYTMAADALPGGRRLVVCLPSKEMLPSERGPFRLESIHSIRVHRSLTRHICTLII